MLGGLPGTSLDTNTHSFNAMADFLRAIGSGTNVRPNFGDGVKEMAKRGGRMKRILFRDIFGLTSPLGGPYKYHDRIL